MKKFRRQFLRTAVSGFALGIIKYLNIGTAWAQDYVLNQEPAIVTGAWRGLYIVANIDYDRKIYVRTLANPGPHEIYGARLAFGVLPDSNLFAQRIKEGKYVRIYIRAIQRANSNA